MKSTGATETLIEEVIKFLPTELKRTLTKIDKQILEDLEEIRLRANKPVMIVFNGENAFIHENGKVNMMQKDALYITSGALSDMVLRMCENSWYAYQDDINRGFITLIGGYRVGIVGTPVIDRGKIINVKDISSVNIRIAKEVIGCCESVIPYITKNERDIYNTLIIAPPGCGKTTLLRDVIRIVSDGYKDPLFQGLKVGVVDERGEIASVYKGIAQNNIGIRTDVINGASKEMGMEMLLRSMSPNVIAVDELGNPEDANSIFSVINAGIRILATAHGYDINDLKNRTGFKSLFSEKVFNRFIIISGSKGAMSLTAKVLDGDENVLVYNCKIGRKYTDNCECNDDRICIFPSSCGQEAVSSGVSSFFNGIRE